MDYLEFIARVVSHIPDSLEFGTCPLSYIVFPRCGGEMKVVFAAESPPPPLAAFRELLGKAAPAVGFFPEPPANYVP
jgi:hypothetical protein